MIKNERQYRITKAQAEKFREALVRFPGKIGKGKGIHPALVEAQKNALRSQLEDLRAELKEYDDLRTGKQKVLELDSFDKLPRALIQARIVSGLTQKELAERLGLKEQQVQRYEATEYAAVSLARINRILKALGIRVREPMVFEGAQKA